MAQAIGYIALAERNVDGTSNVQRHRETISSFQATIAAGMDVTQARKVPERIVVIGAVSDSLRVNVYNTATLTGIGEVVLEAIDVIGMTPNGAQRQEMVLGSRLPHGVTSPGRAELGGEISRARTLTNQNALGDSRVTIDITAASFVATTERPTITVAPNRDNNWIVPQGAIIAAVSGGFTTA